MSTKLEFYLEDSYVERLLAVMEGGKYGTGKRKHSYG